MRTCQPALTRVGGNLDEVCRRSSCIEARCIRSITAYSYFPLFTCSMNMSYSLGKNALFEVVSLLYCQGEKERTTQSTASFPGAVVCVSLMTYERLWSFLGIKDFLLIPYCGNCFEDLFVLILQESL